MHNYDTAQRLKNLSIFKARGICLFCILFMLLATIAPAHAHKVNIFAYAEGDTVFTESYFNDGKKCIKSTVTVFDEQGNRLLEGKTDKDGLFSFKISQHDDLRIVLTASMGHRAEYVLKKTEFPDSVSATKPDTPTMQASRIVDQGDVEGNTAGVDTTHLQSLIEESLDKKLAPIKRTLAKIEQDRGPSLAEVVGGIGYIFGIMGLAILFRNKKK
ncbi:MAG: hypothetical protein ABIF87_02280 [Pseudomonadota bacterium]